MVSKCSNPGCSNTFHYLHEGRLFRIEAEFVNRDASRFDSEADLAHPCHHVEFYWLCEECCRTLTLAHGPGGRVTVTPLARPVTQLTASSIAG